MLSQESRTNRYSERASRVADLGRSAEESLSHEAPPSPRYPHHRRPAIGLRLSRKEGGADKPRRYQRTSFGYHGSARRPAVPGQRRSMAVWSDRSRLWVSRFQNRLVLRRQGDRAHVLQRSYTCEFCRVTLQTDTLGRCAGPHGRSPSQMTYRKKRTPIQSPQTSLRSIHVALVASVHLHLLHVVGGGHRSNHRSLNP